VHWAKDWGPLGQKDLFAIGGKGSIRYMEILSMLVCGCIIVCCCSAGRSCSSTAEAEFFILSDSMREGEHSAATVSSLSLRMIFLVFAISSSKIPNGVLLGI
jgi:hypothetical protein